MDSEYSKSLNRSRHILRVPAPAPYVLFGFRTNRTSYSARSPLIHSYGYASAGDHTDYLARFSLKSEPFMNYPGLRRRAR